MNKFRVLILALVCALSSSFVSCDLWKDAIENSITDTWLSTDGDYYYSYTFNYDGTYYYETGYVLNSGKFEQTGFDDGYYEFSNYRKELTLESNYSYKIITYTAYISNGVLRIADTIDQFGTWYYTIFYR
ncbi:MAG: hypothetical protein SNG60_09050 [Rikenellaceae bacterium]